MPPASSPGSHGRTYETNRRRTPAERAANVRFRRAITLMVLTLIAPGSAQLIAGNKQVGRVALRIAGGLVAAVLLGLLVTTVWPGFLVMVGSSTRWLSTIQLVMLVAAVGWALLFMDAWRLGNPLSLQQRQRLTAVGVNGVLCFSVAGTLLFGAHLVAVQRNFVSSMFGAGEAVGAHDGRYNILLMGGDSGSDRTGLRPDSMTVASIDAETGKAVLIGLPRNLENFRFRPGSTMDRKFPKGFDCEGCYLNGVSTWAEDNRELFKGSKHPGSDATVQAIEGITGLRINYWAMVNMKGFSDLVDAVGGIKLNVRDRIPVGGLGDDVTGYIEPGVKTLNGRDALWYARAREGSDDYSRMARQKCVMNAMLTQVSPQTAVSNFEEIMTATEGLISTDLPSKEVGRFVELAGKAKSQPMSTVSIVPPMIDTANPDLQLIKDKVAEAIDRSENPPAPKAAAKKKAKRSASTMQGGSLGTRDKGYLANQSDNLGAAC